jgi:hypothetical protein
MKLKSECGGIGRLVVVVVGEMVVVDEGGNVEFVEVVVVVPTTVEVVVVPATQCFEVEAVSRTQVKPGQHGVSVFPQPRPSGRQTCAKAVQLAKRSAIRIAMYLMVATPERRRLRSNSAESER